METISASPKQCLSVVRSVPKCLFIVTFVKKTNNLSKKSSAGEERSPKSRCLAEFQEGNHSRFNTSPVYTTICPIIYTTTAFHTAATSSRRQHYWCR